MSTRKLILLALACGLAILVAGSIQLLRIKDSQITTLAVGDSTELATVTVAVVGNQDDADGVVVTVELALRGDALEPVADASVGWRMLTSGESTFALPEVVTSGDSPCVGLVIDPGSAVRCAMHFAGSPGPARVLRYEFAGASAAWSLDP